jgi:hypothetical protein
VRSLSLIKSHLFGEKTCVQLDYAWKWFSYHADQRMKLFNFMLVVFGVLSTAIIAAISNHAPHIVEVVISYLSFILAITLRVTAGRIWGRP